MKDTLNFYNEVYWLNNIDNFCSKSEMLAKISDLEQLCDKSGINNTFHGILSFFIDENKVELFDINDKLLDNTLYAIIDTSTIKIFTINFRYYTIEKIDTTKIKKIVKMSKSLSECIEEQNICETLLSSLENSKFIDLLSKLLEIDKNKIIKIGSKSTNRDTLKYVSNYSIEDNDIYDELISLCNVAGYRLNAYQNGSEFINLFIPYHSDDASDIVYKDNGGIIYHLTSWYFLDKIRKKKFIPLRTEFGWDGKSRLYAFAGKFNEQLFYTVTFFKRFSERIMSLVGKKFTSYYDKNILLEINLNKSDKKYKFYHDSSYKSYTIPVYTHDDIPISCITKYYNVTNKRIDKNFIEF